MLTAWAIYRIFPATVQNKFVIKISACSVFWQAIVNSAMSEVHFEEHDEQATVFKGLVALCGVYFFFMAEKVLALISEFRAERKQIQVCYLSHILTSMVKEFQQRKHSIVVLFQPGFQIMLSILFIK